MPRLMRGDFHHQRHITRNSERDFENGCHKDTDPINWTSVIRDHRKFPERNPGGHSNPLRYLKAGQKEEV